MGGKGVRKTRRQYVTSRKTWTEADARAQNSNGELTVHGWEGGPQSSAAIRDFAQDVDENQCRAQNLERELTVQGWVVRAQSNAKRYLPLRLDKHRTARTKGATRRDSHGQELAQDLELRKREGAKLGKQTELSGWVRGAVLHDSHQRP